jgi:adenylate cyclase
MFERVLDLVFRHLPVERGFVVLWDVERSEFVARAVRHAGTEAADHVRFSRTIAEKVCRDKVGVLTTDAQHDQRFSEGASILELGIRSAMAAPIWNREQVDGLIYADTSVRRKAFDKSDLDLLSALGNHLSVAIEQARLQESIVEQQVVRQRLERYHSPSVIDRITRASSSSAGESMTVDERTVTVLFADVVGFSSRCETMEPRDVAELLNRYFSAMTEAVFRHDGTLDKFIGDCLMAVFGAPFPADDHATRAAEAALDMRDALVELNRELPPSDRLEFRVGMHAGRVVAGDIGSVRRSDYTVLGSTVNTASRLESTVARPGQIVISAELAEALGDRYAVAELGEHPLRGMSQAVRCFELLGRAGLHDDGVGSPRP